MLRVKCPLFAAFYIANVFGFFKTNYLLPDTAIVHAHIDFCKFCNKCAGSEILLLRPTSLIYECINVGPAVICVLYWTIGQQSHFCPRFQNTAVINPQLPFTWWNIKVKRSSISM